MSGDDEITLIRRAQGGDHRAFGRLAMQYERPLFNLALRMVRNREDARDLTQAAFLKAYRGLGTFDTRHRFFSWIYRIMLNECLNFLKSRRPEEPVDESREALGPSPEEHMVSSEMGTLVDGALMSLSVSSRQVIVLRHFLHLSYGEIGEVLTLPEKTVKSRLFAARRQMADVLRRKGVTAP